LQILYVKNTAGNGSLEIDVGASNGMELGGSIATEIHIPDGGSFIGYWPQAGADVGSTKKDIDLTGTGSESSDWLMVFG